MKRHFCVTGYPCYNYYTQTDIFHRIVSKGRGSKACFTLSSSLRPSSGPKTMGFILLPNYEIRANNEKCASFSRNNGKRPVYFFVSNLQTFIMCSKCLGIKKLWRSSLLMIVTREAAVMLSNCLLCVYTSVFFNVRGINKSTKTEVA